MLARRGEQEDAPDKGSWQADVYLRAAHRSFPSTSITYLAFGVSSPKPRVSCTPSGTPHGQDVARQAICLVTKVKVWSDKTNG